MFHRALLFVFSIACAALLACSSGGGGGDSSGSGGSGDSGGEQVDAGTPPADAGQLRVTTFNTGLLPSVVPLTDERLGPIGTAIAAHDSDVICLQEVWRDQSAVSAAISGAYPNIYVPPSRQKFASHAPVCSAGDLEGLGLCVLENCLFGSFFECLLASCNGEMNELAAANPECAQAITAQAGRPATDILDIQDEVFSDSSPAGLFSFGGSTGLILASKFPLENVQLVEFYDITTASNRAAILATVTRGGVRHRIGCTHLQSNLDGLIPYTGDFGSWEEEHQAQSRRFRSSASAYAGAEPQYLAGDFNCSIASGAVAGDFEANCREFLGAGYSDPAAALGTCSYCSSNTLNQSNATAAGLNTLLDHVFTKNVIYTGESASIVFQTPVTAGGTRTNLSDHYGVRLSIPVPSS